MLSDKQIWAGLLTIAQQDTATYWLQKKGGVAKHNYKTRQPNKFCQVYKNILDSPNHGYE